MMIDEGRSYLCRRCGSAKPATAEHFYFDQRGRVRGYCRPCQAAYGRERAAGLSDYLRERVRRDRRDYARRTRGYDPARYKGSRYEAAS